MFCSKFTFQFNNGSLPFTPEGEFSCLDAYSDFIGTRKFFFNSSIVFTGPGEDITVQIEVLDTHTHTHTHVKNGNTPSICTNNSRVYSTAI